MAEAQVQAPQAAQATETIFANQPKLFGKWDYSTVQVTDVVFRDYIAVWQTKAQVYIPHTAGRYQVKKFRKASCPIVERLVNALMFAGRNCGKKVLASRIVRQAFEIININTGKNPLEILVQACINGGAREDSTRIGSGGQVKKQAVDVSPLRRVNQAIYLISIGVRESAMKNVKSVAEVLADELIAAAKGDSKSYAIRKKDEIEKVAKGNR
eukprot:TRINITY_DN2874_c0_g1_i1.p2 TRINITY_DN2874_c0_g1~~TRINITY_DN2874_c0_g1_i1.p2  ORF type:complete len:212 (-),score=64.56 TRINITY_DN2874_c0_g1_i1:115-750(-)